MRVVTTVQIDASLEKVWPLLDEDENLKQWMPDVIETRATGSFLVGFRV
ncbi:MAG: hypothetical protein ABUJ93_03650 [Hyphomicrobium sp.]|jgi:uncharacterized protein YndB with AHSA1/START domain